ncbi:hypothetical protein CDD83_4438 [Cordyceps sp. RAO-2017]|nr:hypothetical protein CDD83_4438 [Cordyceps sp. RAO-2017]
MSRDEPASELLRDLLNRPNVIITSRPHAASPSGLNKVDLELETIGFSENQVEEYIKASVSDRLKVEEMLKFLKFKKLVRSLVRIPIQLDALCFSWKDSTNPHGSERPQTMTALYRDIELRLWQKDAYHMEASNSLEKCRSMNLHSMEKLMAETSGVIQALAFCGLCSDRTDFDPDYRQKVYGKFEFGVTESLVEQSSFLRTSDPSEYFAARYFVENWRKGTQLKDLDASECVKPRDFFQRHKHEDRYNIMWRFVAGLLDDKDEAEAFFDLMEEQPRDLLGLVHQFLVIYCLSEISDAGRQI